MAVRYDLFKDLEFTCPHCGKMIKIWDTICEQDLRMDIEITENELDIDGRLRISYPYLECECGSMFTVDIEPQLVSVYDDTNTCIKKLDYYYI